MCADDLAGRAADEALILYTRQPAPRTDIDDCIAHLVRRRARRALLCSLQVDPWQATRLAKVR
eukprot:2923784-Pyramimonas_sp.AAC.1